MPESKIIDMITGEEVVFLCHICGFEVVGGKCPNSVNHPSEELPPLGVFVTDTAGATSKPGR